MKALSYLKYDAITLGERDFLQGLNFLMDQKSKYNLPLIAANVFQPDGKTLVFEPYLIKELPGFEHGNVDIPSVRVGIFGVMQLRSQLTFEPDESNLIVGDPIEAAKNIVSQIREKCDLIVGLVHLPYSQLNDFVKAVGNIDLIILGHDSAIRLEPQKIENTLVIAGGNKGQYIGDLRLILNGQRKIIDYEGKVVILDEAFKDDPEMVKLIDEFKKQEGALTYEINRDQYRAMKMYVGATACGKCHKAQYDHWKQTTHASAFDRLKKDGKQDDLQCAPCHTTGFAQYNGFYHFKETPDMIDVQCESCHGIGKLHVQSVEKMKSEKLRAAILSPISEATCIACHTQSRDPKFDYKKDLKQIKH